MAAALERTCEQQLILLFFERLEASQFKPSKSQRSIVNKFNTFVQEGGREGEPGYGPQASTSSTSSSSVLQASTSQDPATADNKNDKKGKGKMTKGKHNQVFDLTTAIHASEADILGTDTKPRHKFEVTIEPASFTDEKYKLYKKYQMEVHGDKESKVTEDGFKRFLCDSPLEVCTFLFRWWPSTLRAILKLLLCYWNSLKSHRMIPNPMEAFINCIEWTASLLQLVCWIYCLVRYRLCISSMTLRGHLYRWARQARIV